MRTRHATHPDELPGLDTAALRDRFLAEALFAPGEVRLELTHHDRLVLGGACPDGGSLPLPVPDQLRAASFTERRELAVIGIDGDGQVQARDEKFDVGRDDVLYVGRGSGDVTFHGNARYYLLSAPSHGSHPTRLVTRAEAEAVLLGTSEGANVRTIRKYVGAAGATSDQLTVGITELAPGSVWNTMPCHTHDRRTEIYLYFGLGEGRVLHVCGRPQETRSIVVADEQAVISPSWSVHFGAGTRNYSFVWSTAGENMAWDDMDPVDTTTLR
ncbi:MAG: 5-dehydro-4-deoxy-D-glucuronate isomerase [Sporichthyaceae bacterium]